MRLASLFPARCCCTCHLQIMTETCSNLSQVPFDLLARIGFLRIQDFALPCPCMKLLRHGLVAGRCWRQSDSCSGRREASAHCPALQPCRAVAAPGPPSPLCSPGSRNHAAALVTPPLHSRHEQLSSEATTLNLVALRDLRPPVHPRHGSEQMSSDLIPS